MVSHKHVMIQLSTLRGRKWRKSPSVETDHLHSLLKCKRASQRFCNIIEEKWAFHSLGKLQRDCLVHQIEMASHFQVGYSTGR